MISEDAPQVHTGSFNDPAALINFFYGTLSNHTKQYTA